MIKFFSTKEHTILRKHTQIQVLLGEELLLEVASKEFNRLRYLLELYNIDSDAFIKMYHHGMPTDAATEHEPEAIIGYKKIIDTIIKLEEILEPMFGMINVTKIDGLTPLAFYADYRREKNSIYEMYNLEYINIKR